MANGASKVSGAEKETRARKAAEVLRRKLTAWVDEAVKESHANLMTYETFADWVGGEGSYDGSIRELKKAWRAIGGGGVPYESYAEDRDQATEIGFKVLELKELLGL